MNSDRRQTRIRSRPRPQGVVLVLAALVMVVFFGFLALVIDMGLIRVTQAQMASGADSASLEALRWRDEFPDHVVDQAGFMTSIGADPGNPADYASAMDIARREAVNTLLSGLYQEGFGLGPMFQRTAPVFVGDNPGYAGEVIVPANPAVYQPVLELNTDNAENGDLISGTYNPLAAHTDGTDTGSGFVPFVRPDFTVDTAGVYPSGLGFLVRLRRSLDEAEPGISSTGAPIPLLFGRGSAIRGAETGYSVRRDGLTVRRVSIANGVPAVYVGLPVSGGVLGSLPIGITRQAWENQSLLPRTDSGGVSTAVPITVVGDQLVFTNSPVTQAGVLLATPLTTIGETVVTVVGAPAIDSVGYVPIIDTTVDSFGDSTVRVIGFGRVAIELNGVNGTLTKRTSAGGVVAPRNASGNLMHAWGVLSALDAAEASNIRAANAALTDPLLSPVLVRARGD